MNSFQRKATVSAARGIIAVLAMAIAGIGLVGCADTGVATPAGTSNTYEATMARVLDAVDDTLVRLNFRIVGHQEREGAHTLVASREDAPLGRGARGGREPRLREITVRITEVGPRMTRVDVQMPPASAYQAAPNRDRLQEFFRVLHGMGLTPVE